MLERLIAPLCAIAVRIYPLSPGQRVLDLGCGTGAHLECYVEAGCVVAGVDTSEAMLGRAHLRLGDQADLRYGDAACLPFPDASFDLVTATLMLHELTEETRYAVVREVLRVLAPDGRLLVTDFHTGPLRPPKGWLWRAFAVGAEVLAWHLNRSWAFLRAGGVPAMAARHGLDVERVKVVSAGNIGLYLLRRPSA